MAIVTAKEFWKNEGVDLDSLYDENGTVSMSTLAENGVPMIVACYVCGHTMTIFSAYIDEETEVFLCKEHSQ